MFPVEGGEELEPTQSASVLRAGELPHSGGVLLLPCSSRSRELPRSGTVAELVCPLELLLSKHCTEMSSSSA